MDPHDQPDLELPGADAPGRDDALSPVRDLLDDDGGSLIPAHAGPPAPVVDAVAIPDITSLVDEIAPAESVGVLEPATPEPGATETVDAPVEPVAATDTEPISLEADVPLDSGTAEPATRAPERGDADIDLSLEGLVEDGRQAAESHLADESGLTDRSEERADEIDLPMAEPTTVEFPLPEGNAEISAAVIAAALVLLGTTSQAVRRLRRATPPNLAAHLDALGIDARVEHLDLTGLEELLARGHTVLLSTDGSAGVDAEAVLQLEHLDRRSGRLGVIDGSGRRRSLDLARFEDAWADSAHQVVQASSLDGKVALVPVVVRSDDLFAAR